MAYNLETLITILQQILNPQQRLWILDDHNKPQLESLFQKAASLKRILEESSSPKIESFESQIRDAAHKAEDMIESHMADQMLSNPRGVSFTFVTPDLQQVTEQLDSLIEQVMKLMEGKTVSSGSSWSGASFSSSKSVVVGVDEDLKQLKHRLIGMQSKLEIVPIVGMGGIGKTTLARKLYDDTLIVEHFTCLAWTTISQDYDMQTTISQYNHMRTILLGLLRCIIVKEVDQHIEKKNNELKDILYQRLFGRRYMIVLDDIWSTKFWDEMRRYFPDNNNGSRIVITTRESDVAKDVNSQSNQHQMKLLSKPERWNLLEKEVFGEEKCPDALQRIGRNIASNCGGLPLAIHVIGGLLSKANTTEDFWENVANDVRTAVAEKDEFSKILSLSYDHLPSHLRPCFLYMGAFPEDHAIKASRLVKLWVAEGFLKASGDKSLEEEAEDCLKALVGRNLVSVTALKFNGRPKRYNIHDLLRDLSLKKAELERFVHVKNRHVGKVEKDSMYSLRRVSVHPSYRIRDISASTDFMSFARSFLCTGLASRAILSPAFFGLRLLKVLDIFEIEFQRLPTEILQLVNLRYLAFSYNSNELPSDISRLWNLQTLIVCSSSGYIFVPSEIWLMAELRHVKIYKALFLIESGDWIGYIQEKLQTISTISNPDSNFLGRIPNINKLGIGTWGLIMDLHHLHKLETLRFFSDMEIALVSPSRLRLPPSLRKLYLTDCKIVGEFMTYLCELPNIEVLKLQGCEFEEGDSQDWDATQQVFSKLELLLLEGLQLVHWQADETNFPSLRRLVIRRCSALEKIPCAIGEIPTLQTIELDQCSPSLVASAQLIIEEQHELENYDLQLLTDPIQS